MQWVFLLLTQESLRVKEKVQVNEFVHHLDHVGELKRSREDSEYGEKLGCCHGDLAGRTHLA